MRWTRCSRRPRPTRWPHRPLPRSSAATPAARVISSSARATLRLDSNSGTLNTCRSEPLGLPEHALHHPGRQLASVGVLAARVIAPYEYWQRRAIGACPHAHDDAVTELRLG